MRAALRPRWPLLDRYGADLTRQLAGVAPPALVPRPALQARLAGVLLRRDGASVALVGPPGSGKRSALQALAHALATGAAPTALTGRQCYQVDAARLLVGTRYRGELEDRVARLAAETTAGGGRLVVALTRAPLLLQGDGGAASGAAALHQLLASGGWVLSLTPDEWSFLADRLSDWPSLLQVVAIPDWEETAARDAVRLRLPLLAAHHGVAYGPEAPALAVQLARRYAWDRAIPGSALDLLDQAAARARVQGRPAIERDDLLLAVAERTGLPLQGVGLAVPGTGGAEAERWQGIEAALARRVVGQPDALAAAARALRRARAGLNDPRRPLGSLLFIGPTGVGKTETARALAEFLFGDEASLVRVDMSEYMERHAAARLIGAPPGYVGFELPGQLTDPVRRQPFAVILLDEIEKAHADVLNLLLQILEDGRLTDGHGRTVDFRHTVVILTSNAGSVELRDATERGAEQWRLLAWRLLRPELLNRLDDIIVFAPLTSEAMEDIVAIQFRQVLERFGPWQAEVRLTPAARAALAAAGYQPELGARPLRRLVEQTVLDPLARALLAGRIRPGEEVVVDSRAGRIVWSTGSGRAGPQPALVEGSVTIGGDR